MNLLAQTTETIDFRGFNTSWGNPASSLDWDGNYITGISQGGTTVRKFSDDAPTITISVANTGAWQIGHDSDHDNVSYLQRKDGVGDQSVFIHNLNAGDKVYVYVSKDNECYNVSHTTDTNGGLSYGQHFTMNLPGTVEISVRGNYVGIDYIRVEKAEQSTDENAAVYSYDPGIESYDLYWVNKNVSYESRSAGFPLDFNDYDAIIMWNLSDGTPLNKRIAISQVDNNGSTIVPWVYQHDYNPSWGNESAGLLNRWAWHNFSVCDLKAGDRVVVTYKNAHYDENNPDNQNVGFAKIGSRQDAGNVDGTIEYHGCAGFKDINNNGVQDEDEPFISAGLNLTGKETQYKDMVSYPITVTEDGHLDFALAGDVLLKKIEIYSDHQASMVHRYNGSLDAGYTSYFNVTGQLEAKSHVIPGGLQVHVGNEDEDQHATVVASAYTPVVTVYDENHYKIARNDNSTGLFSGDLTTNLPTNGTYYTFVPEVSGTMSLRFYTSSINYLWPGADGLIRDASNTSNEYATNASCPYYLIDVDANGNKTVKNNISYNGNQLVEGGNWSNINVEAGHTYYLFGAWQSGASANNWDEWADTKKSRYLAGVPKLLDVTFAASKMVYPLAKWIENASTADDNLAYVKGYKYVKVKKMSGGITSCEPYLDGTTLKIRNIQYATGDVDHAGVVLIEITDDLNNYNRADPVFALTVAYDASYHSTSSTPEAQRGHTWDFSSNPLNGLKWNTYSNYADVTPLGTYYTDYFGGNTTVNTSSLLYDEMNWQDNHGIDNTDWTFNYRMKVLEDSYDPQFLNHYDMVGDNADMMWDSEGMVIMAGATKNSIFNEFKGNDIHASTTDPDRYIGLWPGDSEHPSEFIIPWLDKDDRVIIWMGSGTGPESETTEMVFNITNALDAEYKEISATDNYIAGGSHWDGATGDPYYRGCYHFFAKEHGDMRFKLVGGTMCKIYKIQIYHGDRINTNEIKGATENDKFLLWSRDNDPNDNTGKEIGPTYNWTLNYFGKDQKLADGTDGVNNGIPVYDARPIKTGVGINLNGFTTSTETDPTKPTYNTFKYTHDYGQIGTFRMRGKDMEKNMKYVADYAEHNVTVAYQETMKYPYTWDFKDMIGFGSSNFLYEDQFSVTRPEWYESEPLWNTSYEKSSTDLSLWGKAAGNAQDYALRLSTQEHPENYPQDNIFESAQDIDGNQLWANGAVVPETQGLWFHTPDQITLNSSMRVYSDGMSVGGNPIWQYNMVVPNVPAGAAVYMRIKKAQNYLVQKYKFAGSEASELTLIPVDKKNTNDPDEWIAAIKNSGETKKNLTLSFVGYTLEKLAVSTDPKAIGQTGYATESRARDIDHELTSYLTGKDIKAYTAAVSNDYSKVVLSQFGATEESAKILPAAQDGDMAGCILYHDGGTKNADGTTNRTVSILDGGFHVFVPDMHDKENADRMVDIEDNQLKAFEPTKDSYTLNALTSENRLAQIANTTTTNLILSAKKMYDGSSTDLGNGYDVFFIRPTSSTGAAIKKCSSYIQVPTSKMVPLSGGGGGNAKLSIVFEDELFGEINNGIATGISEVNERNASDGKAEWYSLDGQKLNGVPTAKGLYIVNGRKVLVK
jgi:hypothetical protein